MNQWVWSALGLLGRRRCLAEYSKVTRTKLVRGEGEPGGLGNRLRYSKAHSGRIAVRPGTLAIPDRKAIRYIASLYKFMANSYNTYVEVVSPATPSRKETRRSFAPPLAAMMIAWLDDSNTRTSIPAAVRAQSPDPFPPSHAYGHTPSRFSHEGVATPDYIVWGARPFSRKLRACGSRLACA